jgi:hypothetical protein
MMIRAFLSSRFAFWVRNGKTGYPEERQGKIGRLAEFGQRR